MDNNIRRFRETRQWSQDRLAAEVGVSRQSLNAIETGRYAPRLPLAFKFAELFGCRIEDLFTPASNGIAKIRDHGDEPGVAPLSEAAATAT